MAELTSALKAAFRSRAGDAEVLEAAQADRAEKDALAAQQWVCAIHTAFYAPTARGSSSNKFLELETTLTQVLASLSEQQQQDFDDQDDHNAADFAGFMVRVVLLLCEEPTSVGPASNGGIKTKTADVDEAGGLEGKTTASAQAPAGAQVSKKLRKKKNKTNAQPNTPLAFIMVNALKNLTLRQEDGGVKQHFRHQGQTNTALIVFCTRGLEDPSAVDQKLLVEVLDLFSMTHFDNAQVTRAANHLMASKNYSPLIKLCSTFEHVDWDFKAMVQTMARAKDWASAELMIRTFESESDEKVLSKTIVEEAISFQEFKRAHRLVYNFSLQQEYQDIDMMYSRDGLMKLIEKQRWQIAISFVGSDAILQKMLLDHMVAAGEIQHARHLAQRLGLTDFEPDVAQIASQVSSWTINGFSQSVHAAALNGLLELPLSSDAVLFCDQEEHIREAMSHFFGEHAATASGGDGDESEGGAFQVESSFSNIVGLDVEWKPTTSKIAAATGAITTTAIASILQIASSSRVFIIDLLALHDNDFLFDIFLHRLFTTTKLLKVGFGFDSDLKVLHQTFPERSVFLSASPFLELSTVILKSFGASVGNSLSNATSRILGKPLDKRMQMSDWDERPLSPNQIQYAALDAFCLVQIVEKFCKTEDHDRIEQRTLTWQDASVYVGELVHSSPLNADAALEAVQLRKRYHEKWLQRSLSKGGASPDIELLSSDDIIRFWNERQTTFIQEHGAEAAALIDTEIKFLPSKSIKELLDSKSTDSAAPPRNFLAINAICFFADERPCVACIDANCKLDTSQIALYTGVGRRKIKLATSLECQAIFGFAPGTVPPFGHRQAEVASSDGVTESVSPTIYADSSLRNMEYLVGGGGTHEALLWIASKAFFSLIDIDAIGDIQRGATSTGATKAPASPSDSLQETAMEVKELEMKFLADSMVARVGKWLRTIGIDVVIWDPYVVPKKNANQDPKATILSLAVKEQRILLTRDKKLADRRDAGACFVVSSDDPFQQFQEIKSHFALQLKKDELMSRCALCNAKSFMLADAEYARTQTAFDVPARVLELVTEFWVCTACNKIFWEGPKFSSAYDNVMRMFDDDYVAESSQGWHRDREKEL